MPKFPKNAGQTHIFDWPVRPKGGLPVLRLNKGDPTMLAVNEFEKLDNMTTRLGVLARRPGYTAMMAAPLALPVTGMAWMQKADGTTKWLAFSSSTAFAITGSPGSATATDTTAAFAVTTKKRAREYGDKLYVVQGSTDVKTYDSAAWAVMAYNAGADNDTKTAYFKEVKYIANGFDRMFYAGSKTYPQYVWISEVGDPAYCKTTMVVKIDSNDGQNITGLLEWGRYVLIPKERSIWAIPNKNPADANFQVFRITAAVGCPSGDTLCGWNHYALFLGSDKRVHVIYLGRVMDDLRVLSVSDLVQSDMDALTAADLAAAEAIVYDDYYILVAGGKWFVLDLRESALSRGAEGAVWVGPWTHAAAQNALFIHPVDYQLYTGGPLGNVNLHWHNGSTALTTDNGTAIAWTARRGWEDDGRQERFKLYPQLFVWTGTASTPAQIELVLDTDQQSSQAVYPLDLLGDGFLLGTSALGSSSLGYEGEKVHQLVPPTTGRRIRLTVRNMAGSDPATVKLYGYNRYFRYLGP